MTPTIIYSKQKSNAIRQRNIEFTLTFQEWWDIWQQSGKWEHRGNKKGQYVMSRKGDVGPYAIGNVFIQSMADNCREAHKGRVFSDEHRQKIGQANRGKPGPNKGIPRSEETRRKISETKQKRKQDD
jgi:hypothetical protein